MRSFAASVELEQNQIPRIAALLHNAIDQKDLTEVKRLVNTHGTALVFVAASKTHNTSKTALHIACDSSHCSLEIVSYLIHQCRAIVEGTDALQRTALHYAVSNASNNSNNAVVRYLMETAKANVQAVDRDQWTALHCATHAQNLDAIRILVQSFKARCGKDGDAYGRDAMERCRAHIEAPDAHGRTALHICCGGGGGDYAVKIARYLIEICQASVVSTDHALCRRQRLHQFGSFLD